MDRNCIAVEEEGTATRHGIIYDFEFFIPPAYYLIPIWCMVPYLTDARFERVFGVRDIHIENNIIFFSVQGGFVVYLLLAEKMSDMILLSRYIPTNPAELPIYSHNSDRSSSTKSLLFRHQFARSSWMALKKSLGDVSNN